MRPVETFSAAVEAFRKALNRWKSIQLSTSNLTSGSKRIVESVRGYIYHIELLVLHDVQLAHKQFLLKPFLCTTTVLVLYIYYYAIYTSH